MDLASARTALAAALSTVSGVTVTARPGRVTSNARDGWVTLSKLAPSAFFDRQSATLSAVVVLGADEVMAEELLDTLAPALLDAAVTSVLAPADVFLNPQMLVTGTTSAPLYALVLTLTIEVE